LESKLNDQGVDLGQAGVGIPECVVQALKDRARLRDRAGRHADLRCHVVRVGLGEAGIRIDEHLVDLLGRVLGHFLDVHAPLGAGHQRHLLGDTVYHHAQVELLLDVCAFFHQQPAHFLALGPGLVGDELHAEDRGGVAAHLVDRLRHLHAPTLAPAPGVDLGLDHPDLATEFLCRLDGLVDAECRYAARRAHPEPAQDFLALVLVNLHLDWPCCCPTDGRRAERAKRRRLRAHPPGKTS
jgi:hypothetical protein